MKRFGLPILLSAGYASLLWFVFSSDFSKEHSFLLQEHQPNAKAKLAEKSVYQGNTEFTQRIATLEVDHISASAAEASDKVAMEQSPESSESDQ